MLSSCGHPLRLRDPARQSQNRNREGKFESPPTSRTDLLTRLGVSPAPGRTQAFGERKGARRDSLRFLRERGRRTGRRRNSLLCWGYCAGKADGARVNQWALNFRIKTIWLNKCNARTNVRLENSGGLKSGNRSHWRELRLRVSIALQPFSVLGRTNRVAGS